MQTVVRGFQLGCATSTYDFISFSQPFSMGVITLPSQTGKWVSEWLSDLSKVT